MAGFGNVLGAFASKVKSLGGGAGGPGLQRKTDDDTGIAKAHPRSKAAGMMKPMRKKLSIGRSLSMR